MTREVLVLEREAKIGQGISSRNSEVIHAGIYYPAGSLKADLCVRGKHLLYDYCRERQIPHKNVGKLIVATHQTELSQLDRIRAAAVKNRVTDLELLSENQILKMEPAIKAVGALRSPSTGIVSAFDLMLSLRGDLEAAGGQVATHTEVISLRFDTNRFFLTCSDGQNQYEFACKRLVVAAGLSSQTIVEPLRTKFSDYKVPSLHLCRGRYYRYSGKSPFSHLIYPVPEKNTVGLGIHATLDLGGQIKFGPDTQYVESMDYSVPEEVPDHYFDAITRYFPGLEKTRLEPDYAGIRPKISGPEKPAADFRIDHTAQHGIPGLVLFFGIESPGLTAALALAEYVEGLYEV